MNKKIIILIIILIIAAGAGVLWYVKKNSKEPSVNKTDSKIYNALQKEETKNLIDDEDDVNANNWGIYKNEELGLEFKYPAGYIIKTVNEKPGFDLGKRRDIYVQSSEGKHIFTISLTSEDYAEGVSEGCCFYYSAVPLDTKLTLNSIAKLISVFEPLRLRKINIDNRDGIRFFSLKSYGSRWVVDSVLIPYKYGDFSNILISGPVLKTIPLTGKETINIAKKELIENIERETYLKDEETAKTLSLFNQVLETLKLNK